MYLSENIRTFRKQRRLTQEQLAEVLGVTTGAVYKWEAGLSQPELGMILELADFFDTSVDVLLGYEMKDNRLEATVARLRRCRWEKDRMGLAEAEKALKKYPNSFDVVYCSAALFRTFGVEGGKRTLLLRAQALLERALLLLPQNTDPKLSESVLRGELAETYLSLGDAEQAVALLRRHNAGGHYDDQIGLILAADCNRPAEAMPFLSRALLQSVVTLTRVGMGYVNVYFKSERYAQAEALLRWTIGTLSGLKDGNAPCFLDKIVAMFLVCLAHAQSAQGEAAAAKEALRRARALAEAFDRSPDYRPDALRFIAPGEQAGVYDDFGSSALEHIRKTVALMEDEGLTGLWEALDAKS